MQEVCKKLDCGEGVGSDGGQWGSGWRVGVRREEGGTLDVGRLCRRSEVPGRKKAMEPELRR